MDPVSSIHPCIVERVIGDFGWTQLVQSTLVLLSRFFDAQQTFISVYADSEPAWHCINNGICNSSANICVTFPSLHGTGMDTLNYKTIISDWDLECASSFIKGLPASSFFLGCLLGGFVLGTLADTSLGRKNLPTLSCLTMSIASLMTIFSTNLWIYSAFRFLSGFGRAAIGATALVLATEKVGSKWRGQMGTIAGVSFAVGLLSLPGIAYINRNSSWRTIYVWTSTPSILYCVLVHLSVLESPRWLFLQGRKEAAMAILKRLGPTSLNLCLPYISLKKEAPKTNLYSPIKILLVRKWALQRLLIVMLTGFGIGIVYYSMPLAVGNLGFNIYLSVAFNALAEIPSYIIFSFIVSKWSRKGSLLAFTTLGGICSIMCIINWKEVVLIGLELVSYFSACTAFIMLMIYTLELFPTCVRNGASLMVRQAPVFGAVFSPILISAGRSKKVLSYGVKGYLWTKIHQVFLLIQTISYLYIHVFIS
nr:organic cation/carnitine transporter 2-like [Populus alba]